MSWVASASTFLDQVDSSAATAKGSGELAAFSYVTDKVVTGIAKVLEDTSSEEDESPATGASPGRKSKSVRPNLTGGIEGELAPPAALARFKPSPEPAPAPPTAAGGAALGATLPAAGDGASAASTATVQPGAGGEDALSTAIGGELARSSTAAAQLASELESLKAKYAFTVDGYEANLDEYAKENERLVKSHKVLSSRLSGTDEALAAHDAKLLAAANKESAALEAQQSAVAGVEELLSESKASEAEAWRQVTVLSAGETEGDSAKSQYGHCSQHFPAAAAHGIFACACSQNAMIWRRP